MLKINDMNVYYGAIHALKGISLEINEGEIVTLIGANGAGKSTTLRTISGLLKPKTGTIEFEGKNIAGMPAQNIVKAGISQVPEGRRVFAEMTVMENLELGAFIRKDKAGIAKDLKMVFERFPRLEERVNQQAGTLSGGEQQRVSIARALAKNPKILLCDEPTGALDYQTGKSILKLLQDTCHKKGKTVVVITHNLAIAPMADRVIEMKNGKISNITINEHPQPVETIEW